MSRLFGPIFQACYLTNDLAGELAYWTGTLGIGPFFVLPPRAFETLVYRGVAAADREIISRVALGFSGDLQIELIEPGPAPSIYRDFLSTGQTGVHHFGIAARDFDQQRQVALDRGLEIVMEGASSLTRFAYIAPDSARPGTILELIEMGPAIAAAFDMMRKAARGWDGQRPVRAL